MARAVVTSMKLGAMDFLHKPFDQQELLASVGKQMDRRDLINEARFLREEIRREAAEMLGRYEPPVVREDRTGWK